MSAEHKLLVDMNACDGGGDSDNNNNYNNGYFYVLFSCEHITLSYEKRCEHRIRKNQQIKTTAHGGKSYLK